ncbi:PREDICTED: uncharacterized protein LOC104823792 [Tarenaya hassleriana]|uniref:uncharacterized protein LOC104823792 n=1 Tax=Tarenaya hassleriana TaxID=28532 RepID=UPI0008FCFF52|nr:PREDICTED: uncharacterized protein LOC104823792 [Tarenaya hassleriana]
MANKIDVNFHFGGTMINVDGELSYIGGCNIDGVKFDPDKLSWFFFEEFVQSHKISSPISMMLYKLPHETMQELRVCHEDVVWEVCDMCKLAEEWKKIDIYVDHQISEANVVLSLPDSQECPDDIVEEEIPNEDVLEKEFSEEEVRNENVVLEQVQDEDVREGFREEFVVEEEGREEEAVEEEGTEEEVVVTPTPENTADEWEAFEKPNLGGLKKRLSVEGEDHISFGKTFNNAEEFKDVVFQYMLSTKYNVRISRSEKTKYVVVCGTKTCPWRVYCSVDGRFNKWLIKTYNPDHNHTKDGYVSLLTMRHIAAMFTEMLRRQPSYPAAQMQYDLQTTCEMTVSLSKCFKARQIALGVLVEDQRVQFAKLWDYEAELKRSNPTTTTEIVTKLEKGVLVFDRFYVCFEVLRETWKKHWRPVIGLDGCFLKWELKGELLSAVGRDANNRIYPIAWAVVRVEDTDSWTWFVRKLQADLDLGEGHNITILSDKQKGLLNAIEDILPFAHHRMCTRHICANWRKSFKDLELKRLFWAAANSFHEGEFQKHMEAVKNYNQLAYEALIRSRPKQWVRAFFSLDSKCDDVNNNLSESFNGSIREARMRPMIDILESIRRQTMQRIAKRQRQSSSCITPFPPDVMDDIEVVRQRSVYCMAIPSGHGKYEVLHFSISYTVDLGGKTCACRRWNLTGLPCEHALCVLNARKDDITRYSPEFFLTSKWKQTYEKNLLPVNGEPLWRKLGKEPIGVPEKRAMPGRPRKHNRKKDPHESPTKKGHMTRHGRVKTCSRCKQPGHNTSTCINDPVQNNVQKRGRGRPRKLQVGGQSRQPEP